jgi:anti-anti-sigma regulatory factor
LLLEQEGAAMISAGLSTREDGGHLIVTLRGELDVVDAASVAAALAAPRWQVRRILALTGLAASSSVHTSLAGTAQTGGRSGPDPGVDLHRNRGAR